MRASKKGFVLGFLFLFLVGCTKGPSVVPPTQQKVTWESREQELNNLTSWTIEGALGVQAKNEAQSAQFNWQQSGAKNYTLRLMGPAGTGYGIITGTPGEVIYRAPKNKIYKAPDSETLLAQQTGWVLPIDNLYYWMRGLPVPGQQSTQSFDEYNHLIRLEQNGWQILFMRYTSAQGVDLPSKIFMSNATLKIRIVVSHWDINTAQS